MITDEQREAEIRIVMDKLPTATSIHAMDRRAAAEGIVDALREERRQPNKYARIMRKQGSVRSTG